MHSFFPFIFLFIFSLMLFYAKKQFLDKLFESPQAKTGVKIFLFLIILGVIGYWYTRFFHSVSKEVYFLLTLSVGLGFILFITAVVYRLFVFVITLFSLKRDKKYVEFLFFTGMIFYIGVGIFGGMTLPQVEKIELKTDKNIKPFRAVVISDLHIGGLIDTDYVSYVVKKTNELSPDFIFLTGDLIDTDIRYIKEEISLLKGLKAKEGIYYVPGNHEYYHSIDQSREVINELGFHWMANRGLFLSSYNLTISGVSDPHAVRKNEEGPDLFKAVKGLDPTHYTILLSHQPVIIEYEEFNKRRFDLILSGHTHGGQIQPFGLFVLLVQPYLKGLHEISPGHFLYINQGTGFWGPGMRVGSYNELTLLEVNSD